MSLQEGFHIERRLLNDEFLAYLTSAYKIMRDNQKFVLNDGQVTNALSSYCDLTTETMLDLMTSKISKILGFDVIPTYSYSRIYLTGASLARHTDRETVKLAWE